MSCSLQAYSCHQLTDTHSKRFSCPQPTSGCHFVMAKKCGLEYLVEKLAIAQIVLQAWAGLKLFPSRGCLMYVAFVVVSYRLKSSLMAGYFIFDCWLFYVSEASSFMMQVYPWYVCILKKVHIQKFICFLANFDCNS